MVRVSRWLEGRRCGGRGGSGRLLEEVMGSAALFLMTRGFGTRSSFSTCIWLMVSAEELLVLDVVSEMEEISG